jgi:hypothetical protein
MRAAVAVPAKPDECPDDAQYDRDRECELQRHRAELSFTWGSGVTRRDTPTRYDRGRVRPVDPS